MSEHLKFGYNRGLPADVTTAWGCRAVVQQCRVDYPVDRESGFGDWEPLVEYVLFERHGLCLAEAERLFVSGELTTKEDREVVLFDDDRAVVKANPLRSHGYLYVCAYFKAQPAARTGNDPQDFPALRSLLRLDGSADD